MPKISELSKGKLLTNLSLQFALPPTQGVNWDIAATIALDRSLNVEIKERDKLQEIYRQIIQTIQRPIEKVSGLAASRPSETIICDRHEWIVRTADSMSAMFSDIVTAIWELLEEKNANSFVKKSSSALMTTEIGLLLSFLSTKILGQYDLGLPSVESDDLLFILEPNIASREQQLGLKEAPFRFWILVHEITHQLQFKNFPWLKIYYFDLVKQLKKVLIRNGRASSVGFLLDRKNWDLLSKIQSFMSFIEGYADYVMFSVGKMLPHYKQMEPVFSRRKRTDTSILKRLIEKLIGMDIKTSQYRQGLVFVSQVSQLKSLMFLNEQIDSPEKLPSLAELSAPKDWLRRISA